MSTSATKAVAVVSTLVATIALLLHRLLPLQSQSQPKPDLLRALADGQFAWTKSTTDVPISAVSVHMKALLSRDVGALPEYLHDLVPADGTETVAIQPARDRLNAERLDAIKQLCGDANSSSASSGAGCDFNQVDAEFGLTPLHLAAAVNDAALMQYLSSGGASTDAADHVGRLPRNLSYTHFMTNARAARAPGSDCDLPIADYTGDVEHALSETRRLVSEGEPVLLRGAYTHFANMLGHDAWEVDAFVREFADVPVKVGAVPYAAAFNLSTTRMKLGEYYRRFVQDKEAENAYVFDKDRGVSADGYAALCALVEKAFPLVDEGKGLFVHPNNTGHLDGIHYFFGRKGSGAPFHVHADAVNAAVNGDKHWYILTPARTVYSRKPTRRWVEEDLPTLAPADRPLECTQHAGDVIYVPLDWGHAIYNLDENTFGVALELLNRRDTLAHLTGHA